MTTSLPALTTSAVGIDDFEDPQQGMRRKLRIALVAVGVLVLVLGIAGGLVGIGGAVIGHGDVTVESQVKRISHLHGGVIADVLVREGSQVRRGDVLIRLDSTVSGTSASLAGESVDQLLARSARLEAERDGRPAIAFPPELASRTDPSARQAMATESRLFQLRRGEQAGQVAQLSDRMDQLAQLIRSYEAQIGALNQQATLIQPELEGVRTLWQRRLVTISRLNQLERTAVELQGSMASLRANIAQARERISETREQLLNLRQAARSDAGTELATVTTALNEQQVRRVSAGDTFERSVIRSPADGVVDKLNFTTIGSTVQAGEIIAEIVPARDTLIVEARIHPADIEQVSIDQRARIRFSSLPTQTTPEIPGTVTFVSPELARDPQTGETFYRIRIAIDQDALRREQSIRLRPGMPADVFVETRTRSLLSYVVRPLRDQIARAFRDN
jgi:HlyD family type I secretion membrane fusion protein